MNMNNKLSLLIIIVATLVSHTTHTAEVQWDEKSHLARVICDAIDLALPSWTTKSDIYKPLKDDKGNPAYGELERDDKKEFWPDAKGRKFVKSGEDFKRADKNTKHADKVIFFGEKVLGEEAFKQVHKAHKKTLHTKTARWIYKHTKQNDWFEKIYTLGFSAVVAAALLKLGHTLYSKYEEKKAASYENEFAEDDTESA